MSHSLISVLRPRPAALLALALACLALGTAPARAALPRAMGPFSLDVPRDTLLAAAEAHGYHVDRDLGQTLDFAPVDPLAPMLTAFTDAGGKVNRLWFIYPGDPTLEQFDQASVEFVNWFGLPTDSSNVAGLRQLRWMDDNTLIILKGCWEGHRVSVQGNIIDRAGLQAAPPQPPDQAKPKKSGKKSAHKGAKKKSAVKQPAPTGQQ
jgi:hypothetical protein